MPFHSRIQPAASHGGGSELPPEADKLPVKFLIVFFVAIALLVVLVGLASRQLMWFAFSYQVQEVDAGVANPELEEIRAKEEGVLSSYDVVDAEKGFYRVPIEQAMEIYAKKAAETSAP